MARIDIDPEFPQDAPSVGPEPSTLRPITEALRRATLQPAQSGGGTSQSEEEKRLARIVEETYKAHQGREGRRRANIIRNYAMYAGQQWLLWNSKTGRLSEASREYPWQQRLVLNLIQPIVRTAQSRLVRNRPSWHVIAGTQEDEDVLAAKGATAAIDQEFHRMRINRKLIDLALHVLLGGTGFLKLWWNPESKKLGEKPRVRFRPDGSPVYSVSDYDTGVYDFSTGEPLELSDSGLPIPEYELDPITGEPITDTVYQGEMECDVVSSMDVTIDPTAQSWDDVTWALIARSMETSQIYSRWGVKVEPESDDSGWGVSSAMKRVASWFSGTKSGDRDGNSSAIVKELHLRPGIYLTSNGEEVEIERPYVAITAAGRLLDYGYSPFKSRLPLVPFVDLYSPGTPYGMALVDDLRGPQIALNKSAGQMVEANALMGSPHWLIPNDVLIPECDWSNHAAIMKRYMPSAHGHIPQRVDGTGAAAECYKFLDILLNVMEMISGQHEGGMAGGTPPGVTAGVALEAIAQRDDSRFSATVAGWEFGIELLGSLMMEIIAEKWGEERMVATVGESMTEEVVAFKGAMIKETMRLVVVPESAQPRSKALRNQKAIDEYNLGLFGDPMDPFEARRAKRELRKRLGEGVGDDTADLERLNTQEARREGRQIIQYGMVATPIEVQQFYEHDLHLEQHIKDLLSPDFRRDQRAQLAMVMHMSTVHMPALGLAPPSQAGAPTSSEISSAKDSLGAGAEQEPVPSGPAGAEVPAL